MEHGQERGERRPGTGDCPSRASQRPKDPDLMGGRTDGDNLLRGLGVVLQTCSPMQELPGSSVCERHPLHLTWEPGLRVRLAKSHG